MATTAQHIATRNDSDLLERVVAAAEQAGIPNATQWAQLNIGSLITIPVEGTQTISDVYSYAMEVRQNAVNALPPLPGINPGAVTDTHLAAAIKVAITPETEPTPPDATI